MNETEQPFDIKGVLISLASIVVIVAGLRAAADVVIPFLLSLFLAILCGPPLVWLRRRGIPRGAAISIVLIVIFTVGIVAVTVLGGLVNQFAREWPTTYRPRAIALADSWNAQIEMNAAKHPWMANLEIKDLDALNANWLNPEDLLARFVGIIMAMTGALSNVFFIFLTAIFVLAESTFVPLKVRKISSTPEASLERLSRIAHDINHYMGLKTWTSLLTAVVVTIGLWLLNVEFALLWGVLAFLLNFVPNIGSILAAIPAVVMALLLNGLLNASLVVIVYLAVNMIIGNYLEPRWMGKGLGLSTLIVFLSLVFWGWVLGPIGMVISVPLTMALKIVFESHAETRWIAVLMSGSEIEQTEWATSETSPQA